MAQSEAKTAAKARYDAKTAEYFSLKLNKNTDKDIIEYLKTQESKQGFIKQAIRAYIERGETK